MNTPGGKVIFKEDTEKLTGTVKRTDGEFPLKGRIKGADIAFEYTVQFNGEELLLSFVGKVSGDSIKGTVTFGGLVVDPNTDSPAQDAWSATWLQVAKPKT